MRRGKERETVVSLSGVGCTTASGKRILDGIDLDVRRGECVLIIGRSGSGKTTVTKCINGLIPSFESGIELEGQVRVCGLDPSACEMYELAEHVGSVFQNPKSQFFCLTSNDELAFGLETRGVPVDEIERRIEETVEKCRHDLELQMKREGERAVMELGIHGLHPDLIKLIGRLKYRTSFGQNALTHSMEVAWLAGLLAGEMGVNVTLARRAGLLHDIGKALDHEIEGSHVQIGVDICRKYKENTQVIHAIEAHHGDVEPKTPLAFIIQACDAISAARPGARRENVESYVKRLENLEEISSSFEGVEQAFAVQAGREVRIMVKPDVISDDQVILLARQIAKKIEDTLDYPGQIKVNVIRESRAIEYAK